MYKKTKNYFLEHKYTIIFIILVLAGISYYAYTKLTSTDSQPKYVFSQVKKGMLINSVSGSGQVTPVNQIDLKPKASGDITYLNAIAGKKVNEGDIVARINSKDVSMNIRDANIGLESAKLSYDKYTTENSNEKLAYNLTKAYDSGYSNISAALVDIPTILNSVDDTRSKEVLSESSVRVTGGSKAIELKTKSESKFYASQAAVNNLVKNYKGIERKSSNSVLQKSMSDAYVVAKNLSDTIKAQKDLVDYLYEESNRSPSYTDLQSNLSKYSATINTHVNSLLSSITEIDNTTSAFGNASLGLKSSSLSIKEKQNSLLDAKTKLEDYIVRAPFTGLIAKTDAKVGESASPSTVIATMITKKKVAEISLNEVDVAKVKIGQKSTLTFDAIPELTISGQVSEIDLIGTVSQGVVTYNVKITFDTEDERIKPGMSVSSSIITNTKPDVLLVPNSSIKKNGTTYVEVSSEYTGGVNATSTKSGILLINKPEHKSIEVGSSNDEYTEIITGLNEGDYIITRTITTTSLAATAKTGTQAFRMPGVGGR